MKIIQHPRILGVSVGDEVYNLPHHLFACVTEVFPSAVCVKVGVLLRHRHMELLLDPQLWRAEDIENLSVCHSCGDREGLCVTHGDNAPYSLCQHCLTEAQVTRR